MWKKEKILMSQFTDKELEEINEAFPSIVCPVKPLGNRILVQIRLPKKKTKSGLILTDDVSDDVYRNEQTAKVIKIGAGAFHFPTTGELWKTGAWFCEGDYVRVPLHGGDNHWINMENDGQSDKVLFKTFKDFEVIGLIEGNPLNVKTNYAYF